jgi:hypothetical protein
MQMRAFVDLAKHQRCIREHLPTKRFGFFFSRRRMFRGSRGLPAPFRQPLSAIRSRRTNQHITSNGALDDPPVDIIKLPLRQSSRPCQQSLMGIKTRSSKVDPLNKKTNDKD